MERFPIDCFEFFPCAHKLCQFCYHNIKQLKCPYCRLDLEPRSDTDDTYYDSDYDPDYYTISELLATFVTNRNRPRNRRRNRRNSNNELMFDDFNVSNESTTSNVSNANNASNESSRRNRNNLKNTTERFKMNTTITNFNNNHFYY